MIEEKIMKIMNKINYGVPDEENKNLLEIMDDSIVFNKYYKLQTPEELLKSKLGVCWDQVELERYLFEQNNITVETYWICTYDKDNLPSHTFLTYEKNKKYYWFENSDYEHAGIHEYISKKELLNDVKEKFIKSHNVREDLTKIYLYTTPPYHITCWDYYKYIEKNGKLITLKIMNDKIDF